MTTKIVVTDPDGIIDLTNPGPGIGPLVLHIAPTGVLAADPAVPLTIKSGGLTIDQGGVLKGIVPAGKGNSLTINASGPVTIMGRIDASSVVMNGTGGDGGTIAVNSSDLCRVFGAVVANGTPSTSIGGSGGDISFNCGNVDVAPGALFDASGSVPNGGGGNISLGSSVNGISLAKGSVVRAIGMGFDGGAVLLTTDSEDQNDDCTLSGAIIVDAKTVSKTGGSGGNIGVSCGGNVTFGDHSTVALNGSEGGGSATIFSSAAVAFGTAASIKANGSNASGGSVDIAAAGDVEINGKIEARSGGIFANNGEISITNGGNLTLHSKTALNVGAARKDQQTGQITLAAGVSDGSLSPLLSIEPGAQLKADGYTAGLGALDIDVSGSACVLGGKIKGDAKGQKGVAVGFACDNVTFSPGSLLQATASAAPASLTAATGGSLTIDTTGAGGIPGPCELGGKINLKATSATFTDSGTGIKRLIPGYGGSMIANCGSGFSLPGNGVIDVSAAGAQSVGGQVSLTAAQTADIQGALNAKATGAQTAGGSIGVVAPDLVFEAVPGTIDVSAETAGSIQLTTAASGGTAKVNVGKVLNAKGTVQGGTVIIMGCAVDVSQAGSLIADGSASGGWNQISAGKQLAISGKLTAKNGSNHLSIPPALSGIIRPQPKYDAMRPSFCP